MEESLQTQHMGDFRDNRIIRKRIQNKHFKNDWRAMDELKKKIKNERA